jgi:hypothetical protein
MDSDEKKLGGGAGGDGDDHNDYRLVDGSLFREAGNIFLTTHPDDSGDKSGVIKLFATGNKSDVEMMGEHRAIVRTGLSDLADDPLPDELQVSGVVIYAPGGQEIFLTRGEPGPTCQFIELTAGAIQIDGGDTGTVILRAGSSSIIITPQMITIKAPLVKIN